MTFNQSGDSDQRFILGGGWTDPSYAFNDSFTQPALDRSESNGFRCIKLIAEDSAMIALMQPLSREFRGWQRQGKTRKRCDLCEFLPAIRL